MLPQLLQIVRERLNPGAEPAYGEIEEKLARLCATGGCPNPYLALASSEEPREVWWLNRYDARAEVDRVAQAYAQNTALMPAMIVLAEGKKGLANDPIEVMTTLRPDLSGEAEWRVGELRFAVILETARPEPSEGVVFQAPDGRGFAFHARDRAEEAAKLAQSAGAGARIFEVRPRWSFPDEAWVRRNPGLWEP